jgi:hypothetical protein
VGTVAHVDAPTGAVAEDLADYEEAPGGAPGEAPEAVVDITLVQELDGKILIRMTNRHSFDKFLVT